MPWKATGRDDYGTGFTPPARHSGRYEERGELFADALYGGFFRGGEGKLEAGLEPDSDVRQLLFSQHIQVEKLNRASVSYNNRDDYCQF